MKHATQACLLFGLLVLWLPALAQAEATPGYRLYQGDTVNVHVFERPDLTTTYVVQPDGRMMLPLVGEVVAAGRTPQELAEVIAKGVGKVIANPRVAVSLVTMGPRQAFVLGPVTTQGVVLLQPGWRLTELIAAAGGLTVRPEMTKAYLLHQGEKVAREFDLTRLLPVPSSEVNVEVAPGDVLTIARLDSIFAFVVGTVRYPGTIEITRGLGIAQAIKLKGEALPPADLAHVLLVHADGTQERVDISLAYTQDDPSRDIPLRAGDLVWIPKLGEPIRP